MSRLSSCLLGIVLATWGTGCVTTDGPTTTPDPPVASGPPDLWVGTATFTRDTEYENGVDKDRFDLEITWTKAENPSPAPPPGTTRYVPSGRVLAHIESSVVVRGTCTIDRRGEFSITDTPSRDREDQFLDLASDGQYHGRLYGSWLLELVQFCPGQAFAQSRQIRMALELQGARDGSRMQGTMPPYVIANPGSFTSTSTGSWNFSAN